MTRLDWDYTKLAKAYVSRPDYAAAAIDALLAIAKPDPAQEVLELGAGAAHLTLELIKRGLPVLALEPNAKMRAQGMARTKDAANLRWMDGVMQDTGLESDLFQMACYGSSFGVTDRGDTLREAARLLRPGGWFVCLFNHRDLDDPLQARVEGLIRDAIPGYDYGTRREDQTKAIDASNLFGPVHRLECPITHAVPTQVWLDAWASHATLARQAGEGFEGIRARIADLVAAEAPGDVLHIPYVTRVWMARLPAA